MASRGDDYGYTGRGPRDRRPPEDAPVSHGRGRAGRGDRARTDGVDEGAYLGEGGYGSSRRGAGSYRNGYDEDYWRRGDRRPGRRDEGRGDRDGDPSSRPHSRSRRGDRADGSPRASSSNLSASSRDQRRAAASRRGAGADRDPDAVRARRVREREAWREAGSSSRAGRGGYGYSRDARRSPTSGRPSQGVRDMASSAFARVQEQGRGIGDALGARAGDIAVGFLGRPFDRERIVAVIVGLLAVILSFFLVRSVACSRSVGDQQFIQVAAGGVTDVPRGEVNVVPQVSRVTLSAVGDNLIHDSLNEGADAMAGAVGDGLYNFSLMYEGVRPIIESHDINFIDQETILGGDDLGISGYPDFNTPECMAEQLAAFGWNLVTCATNHALDMGLEGVLNNCEVWAAQPGVTMAGTYASAVDRSTIRTFEKGDVTFSFLAYTDVINNRELPIDPEYAVAVADQTRMASDIASARQVSDVVIVAMSWGDEDSSTVSEYQRELAQLLADAGVDLVLGFGPHVIQPVEWVDAKDLSGASTGHRTLVVYSLGNFISNQLDYPENVEGCFTCAFEYNRTTHDVELVDPEWIPLVNHIEGDYHRVYRLSDYTPELAAKHDVLNDLDDPIAFVRQRTESVIGPCDISIAE